MKRAISLPRMLLASILLATATDLAAMPADSTYQLSALGVRGDTVSLTSPTRGGKTAVIFYNSYSCKDCFGELLDALKRRRGSDSIVRYVVLIRAENNVLARRQQITAVRAILPGVEEFYFDRKEGGDDDPWPPVGIEDGLFGYFNVSVTPALLLIDSEKGSGFSFAPFERLFETRAKGRAAR